MPMSYILDILRNPRVRTSLFWHAALEQKLKGHALILSEIPRKCLHVIKILDLQRKKAFNLKWRTQAIELQQLCDAFPEYTKTLCLFLPKNSTPGHSAPLVPPSR
jgi:hypothetical protein